MPDLLIELLSEEIPARMQARAADDLRRLVTDALVERGFVYEGARAFATPRRLALTVVGLPARGRDLREERKGPRVGAPEAALAGFLKSTGLSRDQLGVQSDPKKGDSYIALIERPGRPTIEVVAEIMPGIIRDFPWPKSMRWGAASAQPGSLRWVRPLQSILCTFGAEGEEPEIVPFSVDGIVAGDITRGHRFMAPGEIRVRRFDEYVAALDAAKVVLDPARRADMILHDSRDLAFAQRLELIEDQALLEEVAGLVEWPVVLMGSFEEAFLDIPPEVIRTTIRANQKCFVLRAGMSSPLEGEVAAKRPEGGRAGSGASESSPATPTPSPSPQGGGESALSNRFLLVSNLVASDGGAAIVAGNERVVRARLSDAKFFWDTDRKTRLEDRLDRLKSIVFHEKLGTQYERVERVAALARELALVTGADPDLAERAARLAKADLVTEMVGEFPELQGLMGRYYAAAQGEHPSVAAAIEEHYKPLGPSDRLPSDPVSVAVALADKLDTLVGFWAIDEKPTGSKDPYALRRAALGVIRLVLENGLRMPLNAFLTSSLLHFTHYISILESDLSSTDERTQELIVGFERNKGFEYHLINYDGFVDQNRNILIASEFSPYDGYEFGIENWREIHSRVVSELRRRSEAVSSAGTWEFSYSGKERFEELKYIRDDLPFFAYSAEALIYRTGSFFHDRLKVYLRERGARHDLIDAVLSPGNNQPRHAEERPQAASRSTREGGASFETQASPAPQDDEGRGGEKPANDDLLMIVRRVEALGRFLDTEDGRNLLAGAKRAANILRIEEKKDGCAYDEPPNPALLAAPEERALAAALERAASEAARAVAAEDFEGAMRALASLRPAVDAFFEKVTVNADDAALRINRLRLLDGLRRATRAVADVSKIEG